MCCSMSSALVQAVEIKLKKRDWPTHQSFYCKAILDCGKPRVCSVVYSFEVCSSSELPLSHGGITGGKLEKAPLLAYIPHIQERGVARGRNLTSGFPSCAVQRGTDFFF
jgi:hypothetical protein